MGKKHASEVVEEVVAILEPVKVAREPLVGNPVTHPEAWLEVSEASAMLGLTSQTVWKIGVEGHIRRWKLGTRKAKYYRPDCEAFMARNYEAE